MTTDSTVQPEHDAEAELLRFEDGRYNAMVQGDADLFATFCHDDLVYSHSDGSRDSLDSYLEKVRSGFYVYHRVDHPVHSVVVRGEVGLVVGGMNADITANGHDKTLANNSLAVWLREDGRWRLLAYQPTPSAG